MTHPHGSVVLAIPSSADEGRRLLVVSNDRRPYPGEE